AACFAPGPLARLQAVARDRDPRVAELLEQTAAPTLLLPVVLSAMQEARDTSVLVFEDVHWADHATLDLTKYLGRRVGLLRALLILSLRSDESGPDPPLAQVLGA